jgi:hypothetical protein
VRLHHFKLLPKLPRRFARSVALAALLQLLVGRARAVLQICAEVVAVTLKLARYGVALTDNLGVAAERPGRRRRRRRRSGAIELADTGAETLARMSDQHLIHFLPPWLGLLLAADGYAAGVFAALAIVLTACFATQPLRWRHRGRDALIKRDERG